MDVQATTVVSFNDSENETDYVFNVELDDVLNLDGNGDVKTSFSPSDIIYLRINKSNNVDIIAVVATDGSVSSEGTQSRSGTTSNLFSARDDVDEDEFTLSHIANSYDVSYNGRQGGLSLSISSIGRYRFIPDPTKSPFIAKFEYSYPCNIYKYLAPTISLGVDETYEVAIVFYINVR